MSDYAKGLEGVIANESALSNVEGLDGRLSYLGYSIDALVENCSFEETTYLLHFGKLPNTSELADFEKSLRTNREIPQGVIDFLKSAPKDANPMDVLRTGVSMLGLFDKRAGIGEPDQDANREVAISLCAQTSVIVAYYHRARQGLDLPPVRDDLSEAGHFLYLITGEEPSEAAMVKEGMIRQTLEVPLEKMGVVYMLPKNPYLRLVQFKDGSHGKFKAQPGKFVLGAIVKLAHEKGDMYRLVGRYDRKDRLCG